MTLKTIAGQQQRQKSQKRQIEELRAEVERVGAYCRTLEERIAKFHGVLVEVAKSVNASSSVIACVERFLDDEFGEEWDGGARREVELGTERLKRRKSLIMTAQKSEELSAEKRVEIATDLWELARYLGTRGHDAVFVVSLLLQSKEANLALDVIEEIARDEVEISEDLRKVFQSLIDRCGEVMKEVEEEERENNVSTLPTLVDPRGNPLSDGSP